MPARREFLTVTLGAATATALRPPRAGAAVKSMSVVHESSFIKPFDDFFVKTLGPEYEELTGIKINYEPVSVGTMLTRMTTMVETKAEPEIGNTFLNQAHLFDASLVDVTDLAIDIGKKLGGWYDTILDAAVVNRKWKTLPWGNIGQLEVYRTDWFKFSSPSRLPGRGKWLGTIALIGLRRAGLRRAAIS